MVLFQDIDEYICQAKDKSYDTLVHFGRKGLNVAATAAVMAATKVTQTPDLQVNLTVTLSYVLTSYRICHITACFWFRAKAFCQTD